MFCPADSNTGLIQLVGPISATDLSSIQQDKSPLTVSFGQRSTAPSLVGNRINENNSQNTCIHRSQRFTLLDVQLVTPTHKGFTLPGQSDVPVAEMILTFSANSPPSNLSDFAGLLLCLPIFESNSSKHDEYLVNIIHQDSTIAIVPTLDSLFFSDSNDTSQTSFSYRTCFETMTDSHEVDSHSLQLYVFPHGIHMSSQMFQELMSLLQNTLPSYQVPPGIRGGDPTVRSYTRDDDGNQTPTQLDTSGVTYISPLSTCSENFKHRIEYIHRPPQHQGTASSKFTTKSSTGTCPTVKQYKCVPFDQIQDLQGNYVQVSDGRCLDDIIKSGGEVPSSGDGGSTTPVSTSGTMSMQEIEAIAGTIGAVVVIGGIALLASVLMSRISNT